MDALLNSLPEVEVATDTRPGKARWGATQYLALAAIPLLAYEGWTLATWLASRPHSVTVGRDAHSFSWWWARGIEFGAVALALTLLIQAIQQSRRDGRASFELKLWIALLLTSFWDSFTNVVQPIWFYSTDFINLNEWWAHAPGFISPAGGSEPFPVVALVFLYPCFVLESRLALRLWDRLKGRHPTISPARLLGIGWLCALALGSAISWTFIGPHLWAGPGMGTMLVNTNDYRWSIAEFLYVGTWSVTVCSLRLFVNARGESLAERGLDHLPRGAAAAVSTMAMTAWCSLAVIVYSLMVTATGFYAHSYPTGYPAHLPNVVCTIPGDASTQISAYGPCPGSPGFKIPLK